MTYTIYIKPTDKCNLSCKHCYNNSNFSGKMMDESTFNYTISAVCEFANTYKNDQIDVQIHGGEPTLYDIDKLNLMVSEFNKISNIKTTITTNLTYALTNNHILLFEKMKPYDNNSYIMTSWDYGIRFACNQEEIWKKNVEFLSSIGITVQPIICITDLLIKNMTPKVFFENIIPSCVHNLNFERITNNGRALDNHIRPNNRDVDMWLYNAYMENINGKRNFRIPLFEQIEYSAKGFLTGCRSRKCMKTVMTINTDGSIACCPNTFDRIIGKIVQRDIVIADNQHNNMIKMEENIHKECFACKFFKYCNGECCQLSYDDSGCPGLKLIYGEIFKK